MDILRLIISIVIIIIGLVLIGKIIVDIICVFMSVVREVSFSKFVSKDVKIYMEDIANRSQDENSEAVRAIMIKRLVIFLVYFAVALIVPLFLRGG